MSTGPSENTVSSLRSWWRSIPSNTRRAFVLWIVVFVAVYFMQDYWRHGNDQTSPPGYQQTAPSPHQFATATDSTGQPLPSQSVAPSMPPLEQIAAAKTRWADVKGRIEDLRSELDETSRNIDSWERSTQDLLTSEAGHRIAGSQSGLDQYRALIETERPSGSRLDVLRDAIEIHLNTAQQYLGQPAITQPPGPTTTEELTRIAADLDTIAYRYRTDRGALDSLVAETAAMAPAEQTLQAALQKRRSELARQYREQLTEDLAEGEAEGQRKIREAEEKALKARHDAEADRIARIGEAEAAKMREETDHRLAEIKAEGEQAAADRLRAMAEDPQVQKPFSAFLTKGTLQFEYGPYSTASHSERPVSVSFGDLDRNEWLKTPENFARALSSRPYQGHRGDTDRSARAMPEGAKEWEEIDRLLEQFKQLAPIWVEMKLLRP